MSTDQRMIDVYWTVQRGQRFTVSLTEDAAWNSLKDFWAYKEDPSEWTVERATELVPIAIAEIDEGGGGAMIAVDDQGNSSRPVPYVPVKLFWTCPRCGGHHSNDLFGEPIARTGLTQPPAIWFCERGAGPVLVKW